MPRENWIRARRDLHCPRCDKPDGCVISKDGKAAICIRVSDGAVKEIANSGWLHMLNGQTIAPLGQPPAKPPKINAAMLARQFRRALNTQMLKALADNLGVSAYALDLLQVGWCIKSQAFSFPMTNACKQIIGIRLRNWRGEKWAVPGSKNGLFVPLVPLGDPVYVVEGPTDAAAAITLGLSAIGRPSCSAGGQMICLLLRGREHKRVVILSDRDKPDEHGRRAGQEGALQLARQLGGSVSIVLAPAKDLRTWVKAGATRKEVEAL